VIVEEGLAFELGREDRLHLARLLAGDVEWREQGMVVWNVVGHITLPSRTTLLIRSTKAPLACLLAWAAYVDPTLRELRHVRPLPGIADDGDVGAALARLFCMELLSVTGAHGLRRRYRRIQTRTSTIRGAIDFAALAGSGGDLSKVPCIVWERLPRTPLNQFLAAAIERALRDPVLRSAAGTPLLQLRDAFAEVTPSIDPDLLADRRPLDRDELSYAPACCLARMLLRGLGLVTGADAAGIGFLVRLDTLFERAVVRALDDAGIAGTAKLPARYFRINDAGVTTSADPMELDYFVPTSDGGVVVDAKYKRKVSPANLQQMVTYCHLTGARHSVLVFPKGQLRDQRSYVLPGPGSSALRVDLAELDTSGRTIAEWRRHGAALASKIKA
jgi:hypothetical protein